MTQSPSGALGGRVAAAWVQQSQADRTSITFRLFPVFILTGSQFVVDFQSSSLEGLALVTWFAAVGNLSKF